MQSVRTDPQLDLWSLVLGLFAAGNLANGLWMLGDPVGWYLILPAGVPDFGPMNEHFVRDIGCAFSVLGLALGAAAFLPHLRVAACAAVTAFYGMHSLVHVWDTARGLVGPEHWAIDFPAVYLPTIVLVGLTAWMVRLRR